MRQLLIDGFNDLHGVCGSTATFGNSTVNCLTDEETIFEDLELGGISEEIDGALQLLKDDFTVIPDAGDKFTFDGKQFRVARVQTDFADPILTVAYTFLQDIATNSKQGTASITIGASATATHEENTTTNATGSAGITISSSATASTHTINSATASAAIAISATGSATTTSTTSASASAAIALSSTAYATLQSVTSSSGSAGITIGATATATTTSTTSASGSADISISANATATTSSTTSASGSAAIAISASGVATTISTTSASGSAAIAISATASGYNSSDTIPDETLEGNHLVMTGSNWSFNSDAAIGTHSVNFGGYSDYGLINESYLSVLRSSWSFSCWYKPSEGNVGSSNYPVLIHTGINSSGSSGGSYYSLFHYLQKLAWTTRIDTSYGETFRRTSSNVFSSGSGNDWIHIVVTLDNVGDPTMYIDGSEVTLDTDSTPNTLNISNYSNDSDIRIGFADTDNDSYKIDDVSIWSTELSSTQVSNLYNSGNGTDLSGSSNLAGWWKMGDSNVDSTTYSSSASVTITITTSGTATTSSTTSATGSAAIALSATGTATISSTTSSTGSAAIAISATATATHQTQEDQVEALTDKLLWLDADSITGKSDGDSVSSWTSRHSSSVSASNSTSSTQPVYSTNEINSLPAIDFDADFLEVDYGSNTSQPLTAFIVCKYDVTSGGGSNNAIDGRDNPSGYRGVNFSMRSTGWGTYAGSAWMAPASGSPDTNWHIFTIHLNGASSTIRKDSSAHASGNPGSQGTNGQILGMWKGKNTSYYMNGKIAELLIFEGTLTDSNRDLCEDYLADKYNL